MKENWVKIYLGNAVTSRAIQERLFELGFDWNSGKVYHEQYLQEYVSVCPECSYIDRSQTLHSSPEITLFDLFENPARCRYRAPKPPAKEMTVSEISEKLGYEVKIVK